MKAALSLMFTAFCMSLFAISDRDSSSVAHESKLAISVLELKENSGSVRIALFANEEDFKNNNALKILKADIENGKATTQVTGLSSGVYAVKVFHDANENGEFDTGIMGIPKEGFGFSNDAMGMFGPPSFESCVFHLDNESKSISINLRYL